MLSADQIKPHLLHEDRSVREAVVDYFRDSWLQDVDLVPLILQSCRRYGNSENLYGLASCSRFPLTETTFDQVLAHLAEAADNDTVYHLNRVIHEAPIELLITREKAIHEHPRFNRQLASRLKRRRDLASWSAGNLWEELQDLAHRSDDQRHVGGIDHSYADALIDALAKHNVPDVETICRLLRSTDLDAWLEIFLIDLAGQRRLREAILVLVEKFHVDTDYMLERSMDALARIGDPEAARLIGGCFADAEEHFKNYTSSVLPSIKHPESEDVILRLLTVEKDATIRTNLCYGLCQLFAERGVDVVRHEIAYGYDRGMVILEEHLLPMAQVLGIELPEAETWKREREERRQRQAERMAELEELGRRYQAAKTRGRDPLAKVSGGQQRQPSKALRQVDDTGPNKPSPFRQTEVRVGRNDPCPCGSGMKFKKCCARSPKSIRP